MLRVASLFAGIGGIELGLESTGGFRTVAQVEVDPAARRVLEAWWPTVRRFGDIRSVSGSDLGIVEVLAGGFPCQDISDAGKRAGIEGERSGLWAEFARLIREVRPRYVLVENVAALRYRGLDVVLGDLADLGYDAEWGVLRVSDVGAPHRRARLFILAYAGAGRRQGIHHVQEGESDADGNGAGLAGQILAYAGESGLEGHTSARIPREQPPGGGGVVGDAFGKRTQRRGDRSLVGREEPPPPGVHAAVGGTVVDHGRPPRLPFPPSVTDEAGWRWYLSAHPQAEPAIRGGLDGFPGRLDRLRLLGNAVVPQVAAVLGHRILQLEAEADSE